jgi:putative membrane protein
VPDESTRAREHLANERTLLAWIRTAIALIGLGFVVARFGLFLRQMAIINPAAGESSTSTLASALIGVALVATGVLAAVLGTIRFFRVRTQIDSGRFEPEVFAEVTVVAITIVAGIALAIYLGLNR